MFYYFDFFLQPLWQSFFCHIWSAMSDFEVSLTTFHVPLSLLLVGIWFHPFYFLLQLCRLEWTPSFPRVGSSSLVWRNISRQIELFLNKLIYGPQILCIFKCCPLCIVDGAQQICCSPHLLSLLVESLGSFLPWRGFHMIIISSWAGVWRYHLCI